MKHHVVVVLVAGLSVFSWRAPARTAPEPGAGEAAPASPGGARPAAVRLGLPLTVEFHGATLREALERVASLAGVRAEIRWGDSAEGLDPERTVSLRAEATPAGEVIQRLLDGAGTDPADAWTWQLRGEEVQIGPRSWLNRFKRTEVYDVADLLREHYDFREAPEIDLAAALQSGAGSGGSSIFREVSGPSPLSRDQRIAERLRELGDLITATVEPEQWEVNGGPCTLLRYRSALVVTAPEYVHRQIRSSALMR